SPRWRRSPGRMRRCGSLAMAGRRLGRVPSAPCSPAAWRSGRRSSRRSSGSSAAATSFATTASAMGRTRSQRSSASSRSSSAHGLGVVEDVCQAAGASFEGRRLGTFGDAGAFSLQFNKIITTGEGGVLVTDRDDLYDLAIDVHDCAGPVRRGEGLPRFPGWNFRASELTGAVARVQLRRLDGLLERMRAVHRRLAAHVSELPGLTLRRANDDCGDAGIALVAFAETGPLAREAVDALRAEGVAAMQIYSPDVVDLHVYPYW